MSEDKLRKDMDRGAKAEKLLNDPFLLEALASVKQSIHDSIDGCPVRDTEGLITLRLQLKALEFIKSYLETALRDGKFAAEQVKTNALQEAQLKDFKLDRHWRARA